MIELTLLLLKTWGLPGTTENFSARFISASLSSTQFEGFAGAGLFMTFELALKSLLRYTVVCCRFVILGAWSLALDLKSSSALLEEDDDDDEEEDSSKTSDMAWGTKMFVAFLFVFFFSCFRLRGWQRFFYVFVSSEFSILTNVASAIAISFFNWASIS